MEEMKLESILLPGIDPQRPIVIKALRYSARVFGNRVPNPEDSKESA